MSDTFRYINQLTMYLTLITCIILSSYSGLSSAILCYECESYQDFRCLDPFDHRAFPQVQSDILLII